MSHMFLEDLPELYKARQFHRIVQRLRWFCNSGLPESIDIPMIIDVILRTFHPGVEEYQLRDSAALIWQLERQGFLDQNDLGRISKAIGETFQNAKCEIPFCLSSTELIRELEQYHQEGQYLQILRRLRQYKFDKLPMGIDVSMAVEVIIHTFRTSSDEDDISRAAGVKWQLECQKLLDPYDSDRIFNVVTEVFLNAKGNLPSLLVHELLSPQDKVVPENLVKIYTQARTREAQFVLAHWIGAIYKEQGLLVLVDNLYAQQVIGNENIRAILEKYPSRIGFSLEPDECEAIISAMLDYLEIPGHKIDNMEEEKIYEVESTNRTSAARILVILNRNPKTPAESMSRIQSCNDLIVTYHCTDRMYDAFAEIRLSRYLSGHIN